MKKIFLTSGLVLCMACPAFATDNPAGFPSNVTPGVQANGTCVEPTIGVYDTATTLVAQWLDDYGQMVLNENDGAEVANGGASGSAYDNTAGTNSELWLTPYNASTGAGGGVYKRSGSGTTADPYVFTAQAANAEVLSSTQRPAGIDVNYTVTTTLPTNTSSVKANTGVSTAANRGFLGYFTNGTTLDTAVTGSTDQGYNQVITANGLLTSAGVTDAANYNNNTPWVALYALASPQVNDPEAYGYSFGGWTTTLDGVSQGTKTSAQVNALEMGKNGSLVANWTAKSWSVTYDCGAGEGTTTTGTRLTFDAGYTWASNDDTISGSGCKVAGKHFTGWTCTVAAADTDNNTAIEVITNAGTSCGGDNHKNPASCTGQPLSANWTQQHLKDNAVIACTAEYANNIIDVTWKDSKNNSEITTNTCTYSGAVTVPATPSRTGYKFNGWAVQK